MSGTVCKNCGNRIVLMPMAFGPTWYHQPAGSAFMDNTERGCPSRTVAEPVSPAPHPTTTGDQA